MSREKQIVNERLRKIKELRAKGVNPYPYSFDKKFSVGECARKKVGASVRTAGRLMTKRELGRIAFAKLRDSSGDIQIVFQKGETPEDGTTAGALGWAVCCSLDPVLGHIESPTMRRRGTSRSRSLT